MSEQLNIPLGFETSGLQQGAQQAANIVKGFVADAQREVAKIGNQKVAIQMTLEGAKVEKDLGKVQKQTDKTVGSIKTLTGAQKIFGKQTGVTQAQLKRSISTLQRMAQSHKAGTEARRRANASLSAMQQRLAAVKAVNGAGIFARMGRAMGGLSGQFALGAIKAQLVMAAFNALKNAIQQLGPAMIQRKKDVEGMRLAMSGFLTSTKEVDAVMASSKAIALAYGGQIKEVDAAYRRLTPTILAAGGSIQDTEQVIIAMTARTTQLGLSQEQAGRYMEAVAQIMGKGKLQAEELTKQLSQLDGALRSQIESFLQTEHGIEDIYKAMEQGQVTAEMFMEAFINASSEIAEKMKKDMFSVQQIIGDTSNGITTTIAMIENKISNLNTISLDSLNDTFSGLGEAVLRIKAGVAQFFASVTTSLPAITAHWKGVFDVIGNLTELFVNGLLVGLKLILNVTEFLVQKFQQLLNLIPGVRPAVEFLGKAGERFMNSFREGVDGILAIGPAARGQIGFLEEMGEAIHQGPVLSAEELNQKLQELAPKGIEAQKRFLEYYMQGAEQQKEALAEIGEKGKQEIDSQIEKLKQMQEERNAQFQEQLDNIDAEIERQQDKADIIKEDMDEELSKAKEIHDEKISAIDAEIGKLRQKTPMEEKLRKMQKQELQDKIASGELTGKELVAAQARLERMERQDQINKLLVKKEQEKTGFAEKQKDHQNKLNRLLEPYKNKIDQLEAQAKNIADAREKEQTATEKAIGFLESAAGYQETTAEDVKEQQSYARLLAGNYQAASAQAASLASSINSAAAAQERLNAAIRNKPSSGGGGSSEPTTSNFAGGPIAAGTTSWVNELGKEAFLSASGRLSMINDTNGKWTAPSDGTIIPAHLTKKLGKIPGGGINLNKAAGANAMTAGASMGSMVKTIQGAMGGDTFNQSVTVQAANPTQTANNLMVEMTRLRRRRFR